MKLLLANDVVVSPSERRLRLLQLDTVADQAWVIDTVDPLAVPQLVQYQWLLDACKPYKAATGLQLGSRSLGASDAMKKTRDRGWSLIEPLIANSKVFAAETRGPLVAARAQETSTSENTVMKHLRRYWQRGQTLDALLGDYDNARVSGTDDQVPRGRRTADGRPPYLLTAVDKKNFDRAITSYYLTKRYHTITATHQWMLERFYTYVDGNGKKCLKAQSEYPSVRQLTTWLHKTYPLEYQMRKRLGDKEFDRDHRQKLGSIELDCHGAGHMYEIDATIGDVFLVSSDDPKAIVGKPTIYLIIDRATRLIVGWYVGFESPSWMAAVQAILSIAEDKAELCARYKVPYDPADWPADGVLPETFLADQGELAGKNSRRISPGLNAYVQNVPGLRPDWKPLVECGFKMLYQVISQDLPAYDPPENQKRRRGKAYFLDATLNLEQFTSRIVMAIIAHNKTMQTNYPLNKGHIRAGVSPIPRELWHFEARTRAGALARFTADSVRLELMPREMGTITEHGIRVRNCFYTFPEAEKAGWFSTSRVKGVSKVEVGIDYRLCDRIVVFDPAIKGRLYEGRLTPAYRKFEGMSFADIARQVRAIAALTAGASHLKRENLLDFHVHSGKQNKEAQDRYDNATGGKRISRKGRRKDIADMRAVEIQKERERTAGIPDIATLQATSQPVKSTPTSPTPPAAPVVPIRGNAPTPEGDSDTAADCANENRPLTVQDRLNAKRKAMGVKS